MGYVFAMSPCVGCKRLFSYNPMRVPSVLYGGAKQPICQACVERVNPMRTKAGLPPIVPLPGAYDECDEAELSED